jgi:hypothetical protein
MGVTINYYYTLFNFFINGPETSEPVALQGFRIACEIPLATIVDPIPHCEHFPRKGRFVTLERSHFR